MVTLPPEFVETRLPGYFWNTENEKLYSIKVHGVLKELTITHPSPFNHILEPGYRVSHLGQRKWLMLGYLRAIKPHDSVIRVVKMTLPKAIQFIRRVKSVDDLGGVAEYINDYDHPDEVLMKDGDWRILTNELAECLERVGAGPRDKK